MQSGSNQRKPAIRPSLWRNQYAQGPNDPFAKGKLSIPLDCLVELLDEWCKGTLPVDRDGHAQLDLAAWGKKEGSHERAPDLSGQVTMPAEQRAYYQRNPDKAPPQVTMAPPLVPWDLPQSLQRLVGQVPAAPAQQGYQPAPVENYQQQAQPQPAPVAATARPLF